MLSYVWHISVQMEHNCFVFEVKFLVFSQGYDVMAKDEGHTYCILLASNSLFCLLSTIEEWRFCKRHYITLLRDFVAYLMFQQKYNCSMTRISYSDHKCIMVLLITYGDATTKLRNHLIGYRICKKDFEVYWGGPASIAARTIKTLAQFDALQCTSMDVARM